MTKERAAGTPMAVPSPGSAIADLRNRPPKRNKPTRQKRSSGMSREILRARRPRPRPMVTPTQPRIEPMRVAAVSSRVTRYNMIKATSPWGIWWVKMGIVVAMAARVRRKVAPALPGVGASSRRRNSRRAEGFMGRQCARNCLAPSPPPRRPSERSRLDFPLLCAQESAPPGESSRGSARPPAGR